MVVLTHEGVSVDSHAMDMRNNAINLMFERVIAKQDGEVVLWIWKKG